MQIFFTLLAVTLSLSQISAQDTLRIMPLGNSITHAENQGGNSYNSWRRPLFFQLQTLFAAPDTFDLIGSQNTAFDDQPFPDPDFDPDHEGHWGWRADQIEDSLGSWIRSIDTPDMVLLHLGTNDCWQSQSVLSTMIELAAIIDTLRTYNPQVTTLIAQLIPHFSANACINELNDSIAAWVPTLNQSGSRVILVDQNTGFDVTTDTYDGTHPNLQGEQKIAARWFGTIEAFVNGLLPLRLIGFHAYPQADRVKLEWQTADETNVEGFMIERSSDLEEFNHIGFQYPFNLGTDHHQSYTFIDPVVDLDLYYYRLKILEQDGHHWHSKIISVVRSQDQIRLVPNLASPGQIIRITGAEIEEVTLINEIGQRVQVDLSFQGFRLPNLSAGVYFVQTRDADGNNFVGRLTVQ